MVSLIVLLLMLGSFSMSGSSEVPWQAEAKSDLTKQLAQIVKEPVCDVFLTDFTGDGSASAFVFTGTKVEEGKRASFQGALWYLDEHGGSLLKSNIETDNYAPVILEHGQEKHLLLALSSNLPGNAKSYIWMVREHKPELILETPNFCFLDNEQLAIVRTFISASGSGRVWQRYYLYWDSKKQIYQEYGGEVITEEEFFLYENAKEIKEKVESVIKEDIVRYYELDGVERIETDYIKRDNGIININYIIYCGEKIYYRYAILMEKNGTISLEKTENYDTYEWGYITEQGGFEL